VDGEGETVQCYPDILFAGTSKSGTSSVMAALSQHPAVVTQSRTDFTWSLAGKPIHHEVHIFDYHTRCAQMVEDQHWSTAPVLPRRRAAEVLQLHYTANYMYYPDVPFNILRIYPNADSIKYILMIREPAERAISGWRFHAQITGEKRSFETAMRMGIQQRKALEDCYAQALHDHGNSSADYVEDLPLESQKSIIDTCFWSRSDTHCTNTPPDVNITLMHAHVDKGIYVDQLRRWFSVIGRENCFVFSLEEWKADSRATFAEIADFVGLEAVGPGGFTNSTELDALLHKKWNNADTLGPEPPPRPAEHLIQELRDFYQPYNEALFEFLGRRAF